VTQGDGSGSFVESMKNFVAVGHRLLVACLAIGSLPLPAADLSITSNNAEGETVPARIHLKGPDGKVVRSANNLPFWNDHVSSPGTALFNVPTSRYELTVEHGPEWSSESSVIQIADGVTATNVTVSLKRIANMAAEGWWSGETHIHRPIEQVELVMRAEDLHFGQVLTWWNRNNPWLTNPLPSPLIKKFDGNRFAQLLGGEDERDGGALLFFNLRESINITAGRQHYPSSLVYANQVKAAGGWIDIEKPFWWDVPMWIAHGIGDSIGVANNHMYRTGVYPNEAWGRPRDLEKYPNPQGNGYWTQEIYYHLLNCGIRIPPSAGSASGVLPNPVGYNRAYVKIDGEPTTEKWFEGLKAGRVFVSNGPLLRVTANGQLPGHVFKTDKSSLYVNLQARVDGDDPIERLEVVHNGVVMPFPFPQQLTIQESGWFLVRAITSKTNTLRFASTGPFHVELGDNKIAPQQRESAGFFVNWCEERMATLNANAELNESQKEDVLKPWRDALVFWQEKENEAAPRQTVRGEVIDADTQQPIPARVYIKDQAGGWHLVTTASTGGSAVRYEKRNWVNPKSEEFHTTVSAGPFEATLSPGNYEIIVERGKEYSAVTNTITVADQPIELKIPLKRWINMAERGWYSGDTHVHRTLGDLPNVMLAEDLNVAFPLTYWVTHAFRPPTAGDKTFRDAIPKELIEVDDTHVIWPRNTEWEIFTVNGRSHTLGAVFALGHKEPFELGVPTVKNVAAEARRQGALLDLDKHDWPWTMTLPPNMGVQLYELANNHIWRTAFAFTNWSSPTPEYLRPPLQKQSGNEREWIQFTMANYYALLNCGLNMVPTAGTASGVHTVPLGFSRVYVNQPDGFSYEGWKRGLESGRSFVTTGPMILATVNGKQPGERFNASGDSFSAVIEGEIISEQPLTFAEIIHDGKPVNTIMGRNERTETGAYRTKFRRDVNISAGGWLAVRCWEDREGNRVRYAHTAPWHVSIPGKPLLPRAEERDYLIARVKNEIERSREVLPKEAIEEYKEALNYYQQLQVREAEGQSQVRSNTSIGNLIEHGYSRAEMAEVLGVDQQTVNSRVATYSPERPALAGVVRVAPYPGGRHPRMGFLEGALDPQRDTKVTVFTPWDPTSYVVLDVPEAIWSNLGLTYLAHTHIDTIWDQQGVTLPKLEWTRHQDGSLTNERTLPNGIAFGAKVIPHDESVEMELWLKNGTDQTLTDLRIQNCVMLKGAAGFNAQSNWNKRLEKPFAMAHSDDGNRWIITAWEHCDRPWANPPVPCLHSDPKFPDLAAGKTGRLKGWLWFYEGSGIDRELEKLAAAR